jgi:hypothetical protein
MDPEDGLRGSKPLRIKKRESLRVEHSVKLAAAHEEAAALQGKIEASEKKSRH